MSEDTKKPAQTFGLPEGVEPEAVLARRKALIEHGTDPLIAEKLAIEAESNHVAHHQRAKKQAEQQADAQAAQKKGGK